MSKGIEVSPKHGLNPTIPVCFFCGEDKNEIALLGRVRERNPETGRAVRGTDLEAPMRMILDYEPCEKCAEKFKTGVLLMGVIKYSPDGRPAITKQGNTLMYPTGAYSVIKTEAFNRIFEADRKDGDTVLCEQEVLEQLTPNN